MNKLFFFNITEQECLNRNNNIYETLTNCADFVPYTRCIKLKLKTQSDYDEYVFECILDDQYLSKDCTEKSSTGS